MAATASEFLRAKIKAYLLGHDISLRKMSHDIGVDYTTLHRIHSGKKKGVEFFDAKRILSYIDPENFTNAMVQFFPRESEEIGTQALSGSQLERDTVAMQAVTAAKEIYDVLIFVSEGLPNNRLDITSEFGRRGTAILEDLIEQGVIKADPDDQLFAFTNQVVHLPTRLLKDIARLNLDSIDTSAPGGLLRNRAMGLNLAGARKAYDAVAEANRKLEEIEQNPENRGALVMLFSLICGAHSTRKSSEAQS